MRLAELAGVELRPQGEQLTGRCPFHPDESTSLRISPKENAWRCTGACEAGGSAIEWTMRAEGVSFSHAVELLRDGVVPSKPRSRRSTRSTAPKLPALLPQGAGERELLERVVDFYAQTLRESPEALAYLKRRGLGDPELLKRFRLGYANRTLGYRLPAKNRKAGAELRGKLKALGHPARLRARAPLGLAGDPDLRAGREGHPALRAKDPGGSAGRHAAPPLPARPARHLQRGGAPRRPGGDRLRVADRRAHLLGERPAKCHRHARTRGRTARSCARRSPPPASSGC